MKLKEFVKKHGCRGQSELTFLAREIARFYQRRNHNSVTTDEVIDLLRRHYPIERRGNLEVVGLAI